MKTTDLNDEFLLALHNRAERKSDLINKIAEVLKIEKEAAYRRVSGKVSFSIREMGIIAKTFSISLDDLLYNIPGHLWMPVFLGSPAKQDSIKVLGNWINNTLLLMREICKHPTEAGLVLDSLPILFCINSPQLLKFMLFKWGHYFISAEEYFKFSEWKLPTVFRDLKERIKELKFNRIFYIWDPCIIPDLVSEIIYFRQMNIITPEEIETIRLELKELIGRMERWVSHTDAPEFPYSNKTYFYVSSVHMGVGSSYYASENMNSISMSSKFSYSVIYNNPDSYLKVKEWIKSLRKISVLISNSGSIERRAFFQKQHEVLDKIRL